MKWLCAALCALTCTTHTLSTSPLEGMLRELDFIRNAFEVKYAPSDWKREYCEWDLLQEIERAKTRLLNCTSYEVRDYQQTLLQFLRSTRDHHVGAVLFCTERSSLPFKVASAQGRYFITAVDEEFCFPSGFSLTPGDELLFFDEKPIDEVVSALRVTELGEERGLTEQALTEMLLTERHAAEGHAVPKGTLSITVKAPKQSALRSAQLEWDYHPELIANPEVHTLSPLKMGQRKGQFSPKWLEKKMITPLFERKVMSRQAFSPHPHDLGSRVSFLPPLARKIWETAEEDPYDAYMFIHPKNRLTIGYVRIPHYMGDEEDIEEFIKLIRRFQRKTDALIVDQVDNPGGYVFYMYAIASLLSPSPLKAPAHRMTLTQENVANALDAQDFLEGVGTEEELQEFLGDSIQGYPVDQRLVNSLSHYFSFLIEQWNQGQSFTPPYPLYGISKIETHLEVSYTKPILFLINSLDFSGGDLLPAILQDNKRALLLGTRTAGAGGCVEGFHYPNNFGIAYVHYTASIAERTDHRLIENLGVTPDIPYALTAEDYENNYAGYRTAILQGVEALFK